MFGYTCAEDGRICTAPSPDGKDVVCLPWSDYHMEVIRSHRGCTILDHMHITGSVDY